MSRTEYMPAPEIERLPGEPARWHERFVRYALLPPEHRSALAVYRMEKKIEQAQAEPAQDGPKKPARAEKKRGALPGSWKVAIVTWRWRERAAEFDRQQQALRLAELEQVRAAMVDRHIKIALAAQQRVVEWLLDRQNRLHDPRDVVQFLKVGIELERAARGMPPAELMNIMALSDDQLLLRYSELLQSLRAGSD